jgi:ribosome biogenesis protein BRX1
VLHLCYSCVQVFGTPRGHHRVKPFFDHVLSFSLADGCVWMRSYQVRILQHSCRVHSQLQSF